MEQLTTEEVYSSNQPISSQDINIIIVNACIPPTHPKNERIHLSAKIIDVGDSIGGLNDKS